MNRRHDGRAAVEGPPAVDGVIEYERARRDSLARTDAEDRGVAALMTTDAESVLVEHRLDRSRQRSVVLDRAQRAADQLLQFALQRQPHRTLDPVDFLLQQFEHLGGRNERISRGRFASILLSGRVGERGEMF